MTWHPIAFIPPQLSQINGVGYSGAVLKAYEAETTTPIAMATSYLGTTTADSFVLNSAGYTTHGGDVIIPHVDRNYKLALYSDQSSADADSGAVWTVDDIQITADENDPFIQYFSGDGVTTAFTLSDDMGTDERVLMVFADKAFTEYSNNGGFDSDSGWTKGAGWSIGSGVATAAGAISTDLSQNAAVPILAGESYTITMTITRSAGGVIPKIGGTSGTERTSAGTYTETIIAGSTQALTFSGNGFTGTVDAVSVHRTTSSHRQVLRADEFSVNGTALSFVEAPAIGSNNIIVFAPALLLGAVSSFVSAAAISEANALGYANAASASASAAAGSVTDAAAQVALATTQATNAATSATTATTQASLASGFATAAAASAASFTRTGTSTSSVAVGTGSKTFATQTGINWVSGATRVRVANADASKIMEGQVTAYAAGSVTINVDYSVGSGSAAAWNLTDTATRGAAGSGSGDVVAANAGSEYTAAAAAFRANTGLVIDTNVQSYSAKTAAIVALTWAADKVMYFTSAGAVATTDAVAFGRSLLGAANAAALRTLAALGTVATLASDTDGTLAANSDSNVATQKAVKTYVDAHASGSGNWVLLDTKTASASATLDFANFVSSLYDTYEFEFIDLDSSVDTTTLFELRTATDGGVTYVSSAGAYDSAVRAVGLLSALTNDNAIVRSSATALKLNTADATWGGSSVNRINGFLRLFNPRSTAKAVTMDWVITGEDSSETPWRCEGAGQRTATGDIDSVRFLPSGGVITSGTIRLRGLKNS